MPDALLGLTIPGPWVPRVKAMVLGTRNVGASLTDAQAKSILQSEWKDKLKKQVEDFEANIASIAQRDATKSELESW